MIDLKLRKRLAVAVVFFIMLFPLLSQTVIPHLLGKFRGRLYDWRNNDCWIRSLTSVDYGAWGTKSKKIVIKNRRDFELKKKEFCFSSAAHFEFDLICPTKEKETGSFQETVHEKIILNCSELAVKENREVNGTNQAPEFLQQ